MFLADPAKILYFLSKSFSLRFTEKALKQFFVGTHHCYYIFCQVNNKNMEHVCPR